MASKPKTCFWSETHRLHRADLVQDILTKAGIKATRHRHNGQICVVIDKDDELRAKEAIKPS